MQSNLVNKLFKFCSVLDSKNEFEYSDKIFKIATNILAQTTNTRGYDPQNPLFTYTDPTNVERSEGIPGSGVMFLEDNLLSKLPDVPDRFKNIKMQDLTAWMSTIIPPFNPNNPVEISEFRRRIFPNIRRRDPAFWNDFKELMAVFNAFIFEKSFPSEITGDPATDQMIIDNMKKNISNAINSPIFSIINDELRNELIP